MWCSRCCRQFRDFEREGGGGIRAINKFEPMKSGRHELASRVRQTHLARLPSSTSSPSDIHDSNNVHPLSSSQPFLWSRDDEVQAPSPSPSLLLVPSITNMNLLACLISLFATTALANTEKVIFLAPSIIKLPDTGSTLQALRLDTISSDNSTLKKALPVAFPTQDNPRGLESWYLLNGLNAAQRYEVRICWPAVVRLFLSQSHTWLFAHC